MESPVIVGKRANFSTPPVDANDTGFPFDDSDYDSNEHFQSRLNDIAQRHPGFASHLRFDDFPSLRRKRYGSGSSSGAGETDQQQQEPIRPGSSTSSRFADHSFPSGFNRFPFKTSFEEEFAGEPRREDKPPEVPKQYHNQQQDKRGRKPNPFLPQHLSNTVDLGQKQPPVEETRSQRSMSAPPSENRTTQSAQSRNNEFQQHSPPQHSDMGSIFARQRTSAKPPQASEPRQRQENTPPRQGPQEHVIPIYVESRDEYVHPKKENINHSGSGDKMFGGEKVFTGMPNPRTANSSADRQQEYPNTQQQQPRHDQHIPKQTPPSQQQVPPTQQKQQQQARQRPQTQPQPHVQPDREQQATPPPTINDPIVKITCIRNDVTDLMNKVEAFQGTRKDREFIYLDEMLTRNLIKLDNIETEGKENIRNARKEAIKCIQDCLNRLEKQAQAKENEMKAADQQIAEYNPNSSSGGGIIESEQQHDANTKELRKSSITINVNAYANNEGGLIERPENTESLNETTAEKMDVDPPIKNPALVQFDATAKAAETMDIQTENDSAEKKSEVPLQESENTSQPADTTTQK